MGTTDSDDLIPVYKNTQIPIIDQIEIDITGKENSPLSDIDIHSKEKALRLLEYLRRITRLRRKVVKTLDKYNDLLWVNDIPEEKGCFAQAWGGDADYPEDCWIEVRNRREPKLPSVPDNCKEWVEQSSLRSKTDLPELKSFINKKTKNPDYSHECPDNDVDEYIFVKAQIEDYPHIQKTWEKYQEHHWFPWSEEHTKWEKIHSVYSILFSMYNEMRREGEECELVLGLGLLNWQSSNDERIRRHILVANAVLEFDAPKEIFTVRPHADGAKIRPELEMLDTDQIPYGAEEEAVKSLRETETDDPWGAAYIHGVLKGLAHTLSVKDKDDHFQGEFRGILGTDINQRSKKPIIEFAPALILRARSTKGFEETLKTISEKIEAGELMPSGFADLSELKEYTTDAPDDLIEEPNGIYDDEVFFPKLSNAEQIAIVEKLNFSKGVLVQGPPGTGKSHTIANLISHLLATGQRTLITAKTPRSLQVLAKLIPKELRPLCINMLGDGQEEGRSLASSINGILAESTGWNEKTSKQEELELKQKLFELKEEKSKVNQRLYALKEAETHSHTIAGGHYKGTAQKLALQINADREKYDWFVDDVPRESSCTVSKDQLRYVLNGLRKFDHEKCNELSLGFPDSMPAHDKFVEIVSKINGLKENELVFKQNFSDRYRQHLATLSPENTKVLLQTLLEYQVECKYFSSPTHTWIQHAFIDITNGTSSLWKELHRLTKNSVDAVESNVEVADKSTLDLPQSVNPTMAFEAAQTLISYIDDHGGKLGWGPFRPSHIKESVRILKDVRLNGRSDINRKYLEGLNRVLSVHVECGNAWNGWVGRSEALQGLFALQIADLDSKCATLSRLFELEVVISKCTTVIKGCAFVNEPNWENELECERLIASCQLVLLQRKKNSRLADLEKLEEFLRLIGQKSSPHPLVDEFIEAVQEQNTSTYEVLIGKLTQLSKEKKDIEKLNQSVSSIRETLPILLSDMEETVNENYWQHRISSIDESWHWAQARYWIEEYIGKGNEKGLAKRAKQIEDDINGNVAKQASLKAWSICASRLEDEHRRHMEGFRFSMGKVGKGTGKNAPKHRRDAQEHLNKCKEAIPAWVMPLHRIWDTIKPSPEMFDVIIVDEASQCGLEALPLFYLAKKILIVGDDKQISPNIVGVDTNEANRLRDEYLHDFEHKSVFDLNSSLFDQGKRRFRDYITLREHFRCMPEIIRFSNDLCYSDTPLIALRQFGSNRLEPLEHIFVEGGFREGKGSNTRNKPEAIAIVQKIYDICSDDQYDNKTIGVISLQGKAQSRLIDDLLREKLSAEEIENRLIICGESSNFQGDERDIIFLSMVVASNERYATLTKDSYERSFNVAASRARDKMYLFHSVTRDELSPLCLRRRLLEFFEDTHSQEVAGIEVDELERRALRDVRNVVNAPSPFDSWFEVDVALQLLRRGFEVIPQYKFAGRKIDLVVQDGSRQLAIECDGDYWHANKEEEDTQRQRQLERCGWIFCRIKESAFNYDKEQALEELWETLDERGIQPQKTGNNDPVIDNPTDNTESSQDESKELSPSMNFLDKPDDSMPKTEKEDEQYSTQPKSDKSSVDDISGADIAIAIIFILRESPNNSCTEDSLPKRILKYFGVITRGQPRIRFDLKVKNTVNRLDKKGEIEKYKSKNKRVRLI